MIGDDVVDLDDPAIAAHHLRPRFLDRVLHPSERAALSATRSPKVFLWSLFAAKEATYKLVSKLGTPVIFAHAEFVVDDGFRSVRHRDVEAVLEIETDVARGFTHAVARTAGSSRYQRQVEAIPVGADASREARQALLRAMAAQLECAPSELIIERAPKPGSWDGFGPPRLLRHGVPTTVDVSLSHDGRFVSFAAQLW